MTSGIGYAVLPVTPSFKGISKSLEKDFVGPSQSAAQKAGSAIGSALKTSVKAAGVAAGALLATSLTQGFRRLTAIEDAEAKLQGLGNSAAATASIMDNALAAVKGTAFGMDEAATTAASAVAAGLKPGQQLESYLGLVGDAATIAGTSMADMGGIFNKVMTSGKVQGDVFAQLGDQGIPVVQMLADTLGVSAEEVYKLGSAGKISSDQFLEAMGSMEGAALKGGDTTTGAFKNMNAALSRLGASLLGGVFPHFKNVFGEITGWIDALEPKLAPIADMIGQKLAVALGAVVGWLQRLDFSSFSDFADSVGGSGVFDSIGDSLVRLRPALTSIMESLPQVGSAAVQLGSGALQILAKGLSFLADHVDTIIKFMPALLAGYVAWRVASHALVASQVRLQLAQTMMAPVFLASNLLRWQAVRGEVALAAAKGGTTASTTTNTAAENGNLLTRGRAVAAMVGQRIAMVATTVATWAAAAATTALGVAIRIATGPIGLVIAGVAALAAGLVLFFTKTEMGRGIWEKFMGVLGKAKDFFVDIIDFGRMVGDVLFGGDFKGNAPFGLEEDSGLVDFLFRVRDAVMSVGKFLGDVVDLGKMIVGVLFKGDFSGAPFGIEEDSGIVNFLFTLRETVMGAGAAIGTAFSWIGDVIGNVFSWMRENWQLVVSVVFGPMGLIISQMITHWDTLKVALEVVWQAVSAVIQWAWNVIIKPTWDALMATLQGMGALFQWVWSAVIQPVWNALGAGIAWVWTNVIQPNWEALKWALGLVGSFFTWVWTSVIKPAWDALGAGIAWVWANVISPAWDALKVALGAVGTFFQWIWNSIIKPAWDALGAGIRWVADNVIHPVFDGLQRGLDFVKSAFRTAVDIIGSVWNEMREKTAAPIRFVIDTVYNKGIVGVWNKVAGWLGMDDKTLDPMPLEFKSGGVLPGYTPGRDVHKFIDPATGQGLHLSGGEAIMRPEWTRAVGGASAVDRMNRDARDGRVRRHGRDSAAFADGGVLAFANGGIVGAMTQIVQQKYPMLQMTSGLRASNDLHGQGMAGDFSNGSGNTPAQLALANDIADTYPGSMELIYDSPGFDRTIKNGQVVGPFGAFYTMGQAGAHHHHVHWAMNTPPTMPFGGGVFEGGSDGGGSAGGSIIGSMVRSAIDTIMNPIMDSIPEGKGLIGGLGRGLGDKVFGTFKDWVLSKVPSGGGGQYGDIDLSGVAGDNLALGEAAAKQVGWTGAEWDALRQLWTGESGWNHLAQNPTSTAFGIAQFLDTTWAPYGPKTSDPKKQIEYGIRYIQDRYGSATEAWSFWNAQSPHWYDQGGMLQPGLTLTNNETGKVEPVLTNPQWQLITNLVMATAELLDPIRIMARDGRDAFRHVAEIADNSRRQLDHQIDLAGAAVWAALPSELQDTITAVNTAGQMWGEISNRIADKALAWSKGEWPIGSARTPTVEPGPGWEQFRLDDSLQKVARSNLDLAEAVIAGDLSPGNDPVANAIYDVFGREPILPDLARIASGGSNAIVAATEAAWHAFETGETARLEEWTDSNSQLTEAVLRARDAAIVTGEMVQGAVNGYLNWAMASDSQGRQGSWQEYFQHYGGEYGTAQGDWLLGQVGLGGILGGKFKDSFANLLIETAQSPFLSAPPILDDDGRVIGTQLEAQQAEAIGAPSPLDAVPAADTLTPAPVDETAGTGNLIEVSVSLPEGKSAFTAEEVEQMLGKIDEDVDEIRVKVDRLGKPASVTSGVSMMV